MRRNTGTILAGILVVVVGFSLMGNALNLWDFDIFFDGWWTLFLILPAVSSMLNGGINAGNSLLLALGVALLLEQQDVFRRFGISAFGVLMAFGVILIGVSLITGGSFWHRRMQQNPYGAPPREGEPGYYPPQYPPENGEAAEGEPQPRQKAHPSYGTPDFNAHPNYLALFSGTEACNASKVFTGGSATAIFGSVELDLSDIALNHSSAFDATAIFGGVEIVAPRNIPIRVTGVPIFGSYTNRAPMVNGPEQPFLTINCVAIFGGVEII